MANKYGAGNAMTPHISGTSLDAQQRYAQGAKNILASYISGKKDYRPEDIIVIDGHYASRSYGDDKKVN
ncbi:formate dehydrogenase (NAD+) [Sugiyamaella lignohabitans]|uniref:Formate dehydrogenase (NAD+) n=1 Tax=Sugiyamaella lignohabitans TaxID=796027 RepID=A0A161HKP0_9ASCO|nr:formate dehydrogenase (NAD+) [Sugiyamaella lignohabitans]ANB12348.1 formate dehydrogenase (NAD+) [Sugiyamaella lignohabitans]